MSFQLPDPGVEETPRWEMLESGGRVGVHVPGVRGLSLGFPSFPHLLSPRRALPCISPAFIIPGQQSRGA